MKANKDSRPLCQTCLRQPLENLAVFILCIDEMVGDLQFYRIKKTFIELKQRQPAFPTSWLRNTFQRP